MPVEIFTRQEFESTLFENCLPEDLESLGVVQGEFAYRLAFGNSHCKIEIRSSIGPLGTSRDCGEDSILAFLVGNDGRIIGGKVQRWVTRVSGWETRLANMLNKISVLGMHIKPCPKCGQLLSLKKGNKEDAWLFCPTDARDHAKPNYQRHIPFTVLDLVTGEVKNKPIQQENHGTCPTCNIPLRKVKINKGSNAGKEALTCPAKDGDKYLNHYFQVIQ